MIKINKKTKTIGIDPNYKYPDEGIEMATVCSRMNMDVGNIIITAVTHNIFTLYDGWTIDKDLASIIINSSWYSLTRNKGLKQVYTNIKLLSIKDEPDPLQFAYSFGKGIKKFTREGYDHVIDTTELCKELLIASEVLEESTNLNSTILNSAITIFMVVDGNLLRVIDYYKVYLKGETLIPISLYEARNQAHVYKVVKEALTNEDPMGIHFFMDMIDLNKFPKEGHFCDKCELFIQNKLLFYKPDKLSCDCYKDVVEVMAG